MFPSPSLKNKTWPIIWNLMGSLWPPRPKHPPLRGSLLNVEIPFSGVPSHQHRMGVSLSSRAPSFPFLKNLYIVHIFLQRLSWCYFCVFPPYWYMLLCLIPFAAGWFFSSFFLLLFILGRDRKYRLGNRWPGLKSSLCHLLQAKYISVAPFSHL